MLLKFDYHMKLHYSQTEYYTAGVKREFDYHMKLHYSQTDDYKDAIKGLGLITI